MPSSFVNVFCKTIRCPSSENLLAYRRARSSFIERSYIEAHLASCDFCCAELQLLTRHRNESEDCVPAEMPARLRQLAEDLLSRVKVPVAGLTDLGEKHQLSH